MIDTHCHPTQIPSEQQTQILNNPESPSIIAVSTTLEDSIRILKIFQDQAISQQYFPQTIYPAIGLHPWFLPDSEQQILAQLTELEDLMDSNREVFVAIGEIGLDYHPKIKVAHPLQLKAFQLQLQLAERWQLPVSIHAVKSHPAVQQSLKQFPKVKGVIHGFYGSLELAKSYVKLGFKIGIGPVLCRQGSNKLVNVVQGLALEEVVLETDFPNTTQYGIQQPADIIWIAKKVAEIKRLPLSVVQSICDQTAKELFSI